VTFKRTTKKNQSDSCIHIFGHLDAENLMQSIVFHVKCFGNSYDSYNNLDFRKKKQLGEQNEFKTDIFLYLYSFDLVTFT